MAGRDRMGAEGGHGALASAVAGALLGAAGLAWWLLSEAERRRHTLGARPHLRLSRLQSTLEGSDPPVLDQQPLQDRELHRKVHDLNQAIESVRRQLEQLQPQR